MSYEVLRDCLVKSFYCRDDRIEAKSHYIPVLPSSLQEHKEFLSPIGSILLTFETVQVRAGHVAAVFVSEMVMPRIY